MENQRNIVAMYLEMAAMEQKRLQERKTYKLYADAEDLYNEWIEKGLIKERGYTLRTIDDWHLMLGPRLNGNK